MTLFVCSFVCLFVRAFVPESTTEAPPTFWTFGLSQDSQGFTLTLAFRARSRSAFVGAHGRADSGQSCGYGIQNPEGVM